MNVAAQVRALSSPYLMASGSRLTCLCSQCLAGKLVLMRAHQHG